MDTQELLDPDLLREGHAAELLDVGLVALIHETKSQFHPAVVDPFFHFFFFFLTDRAANQIGSECVQFRHPGPRAPTPHAGTTSALREVGYV
jgi:hypothetical protein